MAHKNGLDGHYLEPTREECFKEFYKAVHELTIDPTERQEVEIKDQKEKITELSKKEDEIKWLIEKGIIRIS